MLEPLVEVSWKVLLFFVVGGSPIMFTRVVALERSSPILSGSNVSLVWDDCLFHLILVCMHSYDYPSEIFAMVRNPASLRCKLTNGRVSVVLSELFASV